MFRYFILATTIICCPFLLFANNIKLTNISTTNTTVSFDISWDNSWNLSNVPIPSTSQNYDAVWIFVKGQNCDYFDQGWRHQNVSSVSSQHLTSDTMLRIDATADKKGVFIYRRSNGFGPIPTTTITLKMDTIYDLNFWNFQVFGIEMVHVNQGDFTIGNNHTATLGFGNNGATGTFQIDQTTQLLPAGSIRGITSNYPTTVGYHPEIPANFPNGYHAFYCMKYEISQEQYCSFLNSLNYAQQINRTARDPNLPAGTNALSLQPSTIQYRNSLKIISPGNVSIPAVYGCDLNNNGIFNDSADGQNIACNYLSWDDLAAYLDWSALRPMTELEFEKAGRGPEQPIAQTYVWGNKNLTNTFNSTAQILNSGAANELSVNNYKFNYGLANFKNSTEVGPSRVGISATLITDRVEAGASYYGIMDLSGNVAELMISVGTNSNAVNTFDGRHGDGELSQYGFTNEQTWPQPTYNPDIISNRLNFIARGGSFTDQVQSTAPLTTSPVHFGSRVNLNNAEYGVMRRHDAGGRGVRTH